MNNKRNIGFTLIELLAVLAIIAILASMMLPALSGSSRTGNGEKRGIIVKAASEGFFNQTLEGELIRGGLNSGGGAFGIKPFDFTFTAEQSSSVSKYLKSGEEVIITYERPRWINRFHTASGYYLKTIHSVNETNGPAERQ